MHVYVRTFVMHQRHAFKHYLAYIHMHTHTHTHAHIHTYIHTHMTSHTYTCTVNVHDIVYVHKFTAERKYM